MSDNEDEIVGKIELAHVRGEHTLGPFAGCSLCAPVAIGGSGTVPGTTESGLVDGAFESPLDVLVKNAASAAAAPIEGRQAHIPIHPSRERDPEGEYDLEPDLVEIALGDGELALQELDKAPVMPSTRAIVYALVGVVRALAGIEETLARLQTVVGDASEKYVDTPQPVFEEDRAKQASDQARMAALMALEPVDKGEAPEVPPSWEDDGGR